MHELFHYLFLNCSLLILPYHTRITLWKLCLYETLWKTFITFCVLGFEHQCFIHLSYQEIRKTYFPYKLPLCGTGINDRSRHLGDGVHLILFNLITCSQIFRGIFYLLKSTGSPSAWIRHWVSTCWNKVLAIIEQCLTWEAFNLAFVNY